MCDQRDAFRYWITSLARASTYGIDTAKYDSLSMLRRWPVIAPGG